MGVLVAVINITKSFQKYQYEDQYFSKLFYLKKYDFCIQKMDKKKANGQEKKTESNQKKSLIKKKKNSVIHVNLVHFKQCRAFFRSFMHAVFECMRVCFSKFKKTPYFGMCLCIFALFLSFFYHFVKKVSSCLYVLEHELLQYYYLHIFCNLAVYNYMYE